MSSREVVLHNQCADYTILSLRPKGSLHPAYQLGIGRLLFSLTSYTDRQGDIHGILSDSWEENIQALTNAGVKQLDLIRRRRTVEPIYLHEGYRVWIGGWKQLQAETRQGEGVDGLKVFDGSGIVKNAAHPSANLLIREDQTIDPFHAEIAMLGGAALVRVINPQNPVTLLEQGLA